MLVFFFFLATFVQNVYAKGDRIPLFADRTDLVVVHSSELSTVHELVFAIPQKNIDTLEKVLLDISDPSSINYAKHWTMEEVGKTIENKVSHDVVMDYLLSCDVDIVSKSAYGEYITASANISTWNIMLGTTFHHVNKIHDNGLVEPLIRAEEYFIPRLLHDHLDYVLNIVEIPKSIAAVRDTRIRDEKLPYSYGFLLP